MFSLPPGVETGWRRPRVRLDRVGEALNPGSGGNADRACGFLRIRCEGFCIAMDTEWTSH